MPKTRPVTPPYTTDDLNSIFTRIYYAKVVHEDPATNAIVLHGFTARDWKLVQDLLGSPVDAAYTECGDGSLYALLPDPVIVEDETNWKSIWINTSKYEVKKKND